MKLDLGDWSALAADADVLFRLGDVKAAIDVQERAILQRASLLNTDDYLSLGK